MVLFQSVVLEWLVGRCGSHRRWWFQSYRCLCLCMLVFPQAPFSTFERNLFFSSQWPLLLFGGTDFPWPRIGFNEKKSKKMSTLCWSSLGYTIRFFRWNTPLKFNIAPETWWLEDDPFLLGWQIVRVYVKLPGNMRLKSIDHKKAPPKKCQVSGRFLSVTRQRICMSYRWYDIFIFVSSYWSTYLTGWWFQIFFIFPPIWGRFPLWLIFFNWVETTN